LSAPGRITDQVYRLQSTGKPLTGYNSILFWHERDREVWKYTGHSRYACGTSFAFLKTWWDGVRFAPMATCSDNEMLRRAGHNVITVSDGCPFIVARIHEGNSSPKVLVEQIKKLGVKCTNWELVPWETMPEYSMEYLGVTSCELA
jgi:hypothetical protein